MQAYLINLDRDSERLSWMNGQLEAAGISYTRIPAVDGRRLTQKQKAYHAAHPERAQLSLPEIGCLLSHMDVWRRVAEDGRTSLVMEDDVHIAPDFGDLLGQAEVFADDMVVHRFETVLARVTASRASVQRVGKRKAIQLYTNHAGAAAYAITPVAASALLAASPRFTTLPDGEMFDFSRRALRILRVIQWTPAPCIQDQFVKGASGRSFGSHLAANRADIRSGRMKSSAGGADLRNLLRPAWTALRGAALAPLGRDRMLVPFR